MHTTVLCTVIILSQLLQALLRPCRVRPRGTGGSAGRRAASPDRWSTSPVPRTSSSTRAAAAGGWPCTTHADVTRTHSRLHYYYCTILYISFCRLRAQAVQLVWGVVRARRGRPRVDRLHHVQPGERTAQPGVRPHRPVRALRRLPSSGHRHILLVQVSISTQSCTATKSNQVYCLLS